MNIKNMSESQLLKIITNGYRGDPSKGDGYDYVDYIDDINKRYWELSSNKIIDDLESKLEQMYTDEYEDHMRQLTKLDFNSEADLFLAMYQPREIEGNKLGNKNTYAQYKRGLTRLMEFMVANGIANVNDIRLPELTRLQDDLLKSYNPTTTQGYLGVIKEFFYYLHNRGKLQQNDFVSFRIIQTSKRDQKKMALTESQANRVMSHVMALPDTPNRLMDKLIMLIMVNTGIREEEITKIQIKDCVLQEGHLIIHIKGKGMRNRFVSLSKEVTVKLLDLRLKIESAIMSPLGNDDYLIQSMAKNKQGKNSSPMHRTCLYARVSGISEEVGIYFTVHGLRRTLATILYKRGTPIEVIQRILGHESATTTQGYIDMEIDKEVGIKHAVSMVG